MRTFNLENDGNNFDEPPPNRPPRPQSDISEQVDAALTINVQSLTGKVDEIRKARDFVEKTMFTLDEAITNIKGQIEETQMRVRAGGEYADPVWWRRVNGAARAKGRYRQQLQLKLGELNRMLRITESGTSQMSQERMFIQVAKMKLPPQQYDELWRLVHELERTPPDK